MITCHLNKHDLSYRGDTSFGNMLFRIASTIGIATMKGYDYGFNNWANQQFFVNELPKNNRILPGWKMPANYEGFDFGFQTFDVPDNVLILGEMASWKYFQHCEDLIRHYFEMKYVCPPIKDTILVHYRAYDDKWLNSWLRLDADYYQRAVKMFPKKDVLVITDNIDMAMEKTGLNAQFTSNAPIVDFYLLSNADYCVMGNSTFSAWASWLADCPTIAPKEWFTDRLRDAPFQEIYHKNCTVI